MDRRSSSRGPIYKWMLAALDAGDLEDRARVSTVRANPNSADPTRNVICIYTYGDEADVWRVRDGLRRRGIAGALSWKPDQATRDGLYQVRDIRG